MKKIKLNHIDEYVKKEKETIKKLIKKLETIPKDKNEEFLNIIKTKKYTTSNGRIIFTSTIEKAKDRYGLSMDYVLGGKTGTTGDAGYCLANLLAIFANVFVGAIPMDTGICTPLFILLIAFTQ